MKRLLLLSGVLSFVLISCYPGGPDYVSDYDLAITRYDQDFDFKAQNPNKTVVVSDTVYEMGDEDTDNKWNSKYDDHIISEIKTNLSNYGWTVIDESDTTQGLPDAAVLISGLVSQYSGYVWTGGGYCGWYWYYCGGYYPPYWGGYTYSYDVGTVMIDMFHYATSTPDTIHGVWNAGVNGLAGQSSAQGTRDRLTKQIDKCFAQSPYLKLN